MRVDRAWNYQVLPMIKENNWLSFRPSFFTLFRSFSSFWLRIINLMRSVNTIHEHSMFTLNKNRFLFFTCSLSIYELLRNCIRYDNVLQNILSSPLFRIRYLCYSLKRNIATNMLKVERFTHTGRTRKTSKTSMMMMMILDWRLLEFIAKLFIITLFGCVCIVIRIR